MSRFTPFTLFNVAALVGLMLLLSACAPPDTLEKFADDAKEAIAREYLQQLQAGDIAGLIAQLEPSLRTPDALTQFEAMRAALPAAAPAAANLIGYQVAYASDAARYNVSYQFGYDSAWLAANVAWAEPTNGSARQILGMNVYRLKEPLEKTHALNFARASLRHYVFATLAVAIPMFCLVTLVACIRTKPLRRKWLWCIFICVGVCTFSLNWTTGEVAIRFLSMLLFGAGAFTRSIYSAWAVSLALPIGAILFWIKRRQLRRADAVRLSALAP